MPACFPEAFAPLLSAKGRGRVSLGNGESMVPGGGVGTSGPPSRPRGNLPVRNVYESLVLRRGAVAFAGDFKTRTGVSSGVPEGLL